MTMMEQ
jgi:hypothetical protein